MKTITLKPDGRFEHQWLNSHGDNIPENAIQVKDEVFMTLSQNPDTKTYDRNTKIIGDYVEPFNFTNAFNEKMTKVVTGFKLQMSVITLAYTAEDIASFPVQESEAKAWNADNTVETPLLDAMVANRPSVDKATLVSRILANSVLYKHVAGPAIGKKQHFEDLLYALKAQHEDPEQPDVTQADFDAIAVDFS